MVITSCNLCGSDKLSIIIDLRYHPLADTFVKEAQLREPESRYPLRVLLCEDCGHAMSQYDVPPSVRYQENEYSYDSANSKVSIAHFGEMANEIIGKVGIGKDDLVVDIGSNVGTLLEAFRTKSACQVLGIEPAPNMVAKALQNNVPTVPDFFNKRSADKILEIKKAKAITITNAFNHISNLEEFMTQIARTLDPAGAFVIEAPHLAHLVEKTAFDTIFLEHVSYFAVTPLVPFFKRFGLIITDLYENEYMGGSVRIYVSKTVSQSPKVDEYIAREKRMGLFSLETYRELMTRVAGFKQALVFSLYEAKKNGGRIIGIGAATKGNTLLNYCGIDSTLLDFVTDASAYKIGKYTPGSHILIQPDEAITNEITHALILPWNIALFLKEKLGSKFPSMNFIIP